MSAATHVKRPSLRGPRFRIILGFLVLLIIVAMAGWWVLHHNKAVHNNSTSGDPGPPTVKVKIAPIRITRLTETATAYGTVIAQPGMANTISVPFESHIHHVLVAAGESVKRGDRLITIGPSPATKLRIGQARAAYDAAQRELQHTRQRYEMNFATNQDLSNAEMAATTARLEWENLSPVANEGPLVADADAIVGAVSVQDGAIVPPGQPLMELVAREDIEIRLGVEPEDAAYLKPGDKVKLMPVHAAEAPTFESTVRLVAQRVDPITHLVNVFVTPPAGTHLLLDAFLQAEMNTASSIGMVVPRDALLPNGDELYTVAAGHAKLHRVQKKLETPQLVQVEGADLKAGDSVVVQGNHELSDGMSVQLTSQP